MLRGRKQRVETVPGWVCSLTQGGLKASMKGGGLSEEIQQEKHSDVLRRSAQRTAYTVGIEIRKTIDDEEPKAN